MEDGKTKWDIKINKGDLKSWVPSKGVYNPPPSTRWIRLPVDHIEPSVVFMAMGKNGSCFKGITIYSGVDYIWYKDEDKCIEIYGNPRYYNDAVKRIHDRIEIAKSYQDTYVYIKEMVNDIFDKVTKKTITTDTN